MAPHHSLSPPSEAEGVARHLMSRRSVREYAVDALTMSDAARLLWAGQGVSHSSGKRTAPSAHALHPLSLYLVAGEVEELEAGLYGYDPRAHALDTIGHGDLRSDLYQASLEDQPWVASCAALIVIAGDGPRSEAEFSDQPPDGRRGLRYMYMEAGAVAQNIALQAVELPVGTVIVGGFDDDRVRELLGIQTEPLIMMPVGRVRD